MRGEIFRDLFIHPENPLWAWCDFDMHFGRLDHVPLALGSTMAFITFTPYTPSLLFMAGQLTLFNLEAPNHMSAWKRYPPLASPQAFLVKRIEDGGYPEGSIDESWLSAAYMQGEPPSGGPGRGLDWAVMSDVHGQDIFVRTQTNVRFQAKSQWQVPGFKFIISGRDVLEVDSRLSREEIESVLEDARSESVDEYDSWTSKGKVVDAKMLRGEVCDERWFEPQFACAL